MHFRQIFGFVACLLAWLAIPNLLFLSLSHFFFTDRLPINLDYLAVGILLCFFRTGKLRFALAASVVAADAVFSFCRIFYFSPSAALSTARDLRFLDHRELLVDLTGALLLVASIALLMYACDGFARRTCPSPLPRAVLLGSCLALLAAFEVWNGGTQFFFRPKAVLARVANSQAHHAYRAYRLAQHHREIFDDHPQRFALQHASGRLAADRYHSIVLITAESWGRLLSPHDQSVLEQIISGPARAAGFDVHSGSIAFNGPTIYGEFRELCASTVPPDLENVTQPGCLPAQLHQRGYATYAIHANTGGMYEREAWYPRIGFDHLLFGEALQSLGVRSRCGVAFPGACDEDVAAHISDMLTSPEKRFIYWMTLEAHLPISSADVKRSEFDCDHLASREPEICSFLKVQWNTLHSIARIIEGAAGTNTAFLIVGDHAPPFASPARRAFWDQNAVPYILVTPPAPSAPQVLVRGTARPPQPAHVPAKQISASASAIDGLF